MSFSAPWRLRKPSPQKLLLCTRLFSSSSAPSRGDNKFEFHCGNQKQNGFRSPCLRKVSKVLQQDVRSVNTCIQVEKIGSSLSNDEGKIISQRSNTLHRTEEINKQCMIKDSNFNVKNNLMSNRSIDEFETKWRKNLNAENDKMVSNCVFSHQDARINHRLDEIEVKQWKDLSVESKDIVSNLVFSHPNVKIGANFDQVEAKHGKSFSMEDPESISHQKSNINILRKRHLDHDEVKQGKCLNIESAEMKSGCAISHHQDGKMNKSRERNIDEIEAKYGKDLNSMKIGEMFSKQEVKVINGLCSYLSSNTWNASTHLFLDEHATTHISDLIVAKVIQQQRNLSITTPFFHWACAKIGYGIHSCHVYLVNLGEESHFDEMWALLDHMKNASCLITSETFCIFIKAYGRAHQPEMAIDAFKRAITYNPIIADMHIYGELLRALFLSRLIDEAKLCYSRILKDGLNLDAYALSSLIRGFAMSYNVADAKVCFDIMLREGLEPDIFTHNALIEGFCELNALSDAMETFSTLQKRGLRPIVSTFNILIGSLCKVGRLDDGIDLFSNMKTTCLPNQFTFNIVLQGLLNGGSLFKAMEFFKLMENEGWVDAMSFIYLSNGLRQAKQTQEMYTFLKTLFAKYGYANQEVCIAHLHNLCHLGKLDEAEEVFTNMVTTIKDPNIPSYAMMISSYCRLEKYEEAINLLTQLRCRGGKTNSFCYTPLIGALLKKKRTDDAMRYFEEMVELGLEVNNITCNFLLEELCKEGMAKDASMVCRTMLRNRLIIRSGSLFLFMKCLYKQKKVDDANLLFKDMCKMHCLPSSNGILQALGVVEKMGMHNTH